MKALLTGAGGFCGRHLTSYLESEGVQVYSAGCSTTGAASHYHVQDMTDVSGWVSVLEDVRPDYIFHLAGAVHVPDSRLYYRVNTEIALALFETLVANLALRCPILVVGTSAEYGQIGEGDLPIRESSPSRPYNHYGISKLAQTFEALAAGRKGIPVVVVRPFNIVGAGMPDYLVVQSFASQIKRISMGLQAPFIEVGNLESSRDFISVTDVIRVYWKLIRTPEAYGEIVNVCSGVPVPVGDVLRRLLLISGLHDVEIRSDRSRLKAVDVPAHFGSVEKLRRYIGTFGFKDLDATLEDILSGAES
jgi:GDP-4-dehydro-6-deoxy-D-mannose reductase